MNEHKPNQTILIVDDVPENLKLLVEILRPHYKIAVATNGMDTVRMAKSNHPPDLIMLDIMMPEMSGYEVCMELKSDPRTKDIPIIFLTAMTNEDDETKGFSMGAVDYITKPFRPAVVTSRIKTHLELKRRQTQLREQTEVLNQALKDLDLRNRFIRRTFGRYLSDEVANAILETPDGLEIGGQKRDLTLLMTDIRDFTRITEKLPAEDVVTIINIYLGIMIDIILKYHGTIDEFIGDSILVIFGAPLFFPDHACRAVACALEMQMAMDEVNQTLRQKGYPTLTHGIAIHTGCMVVGNIGSEKRSKYGVVGKNVNRTARIQSYTVGNQTLLSEASRKACGSVLRIDNTIEIRSKGLSDPIKVYEVGGITGAYNITLPPKHNPPLLPLSNPIPVGLHIILETQGFGDLHHGDIIALNAEAAQIKVRRPFRHATNFKILIYPQEPSAVTLQLTGKALANTQDSPPCIQVHFTSIPDDTRQFLEKIRPGEE